MCTGEQRFSKEEIGVALPLFVARQVLLFAGRANDERGLALFGGDCHGRHEHVVQRRRKPVVLLELSSDRFNERLLSEGFDNARARRLNEGKELGGSKRLLVGEGHSQAQLIVRLSNLVEPHAADDTTHGLGAPPPRFNPYLTLMLCHRKLAAMKVRLLGSRSTPRSRLVLLLGGLLSVAFSITLVRNLIGAYEANAEVSHLRDENAALQARADALATERILLDDPAFLGLIARGYSLGSPVERPFILAGEPPTLPLDAPGSAERRVTTGATTPTPLERWIQLLFGG